MTQSRRSTSRAKVQIVDKKSLDNAVADSIMESGKYPEYVDKFSKKGTDRVLFTLRDQSIQLVDQLRERFPNFEEVIDFILEEMTLGILSKTSYFKIPPIALGGPPGIGKTQFCKELAQIVGVRSEFVSCSSNNSDFAIAGLDRGYTSAYPGVIAEYYRRNACANPLFVLDEFEKPSQESRSKNSNFTFHGAFFTLFESSSSNEFEDNFYKIKFDTSHINWVVTVNDFEVLPEPIQSRLTYFEVREPTQEQREKICKSIYAVQREEFICKRSIRFEEELTGDSLTLLASNNPREMRKAVQSAMTKTVMLAYKPGSRHDDISDLTFKVEPVSVPVPPPKPTDQDKPVLKGIGFMAAI